MPRYLPKLLLLSGLTLVLADAPLALAVDETPAVVAAKAQAERTATRAHQVARRVANGLDRARVGRNPIRVRCLDRTLAEVNSVARLLRHERRDLHRVDAGELRHRQGVFAVLDRRLTDLETQAIGCEGGRAEASGETRVEVYISPDAPREDPGQPRPLPSRGHLFRR